MSSMHDIDYSSQPVPQSWTDAAVEAPGAGQEVVAGYEGPRIRVVPTPGIDMFTAFFATTAACMVSGYAWYVLYRDGFTNPIAAIVLGLVIALALRLSVGSGEAQTRSVLGVLFYLLTASIVILLIASQNYEALYGARPSLGQLEDELLRTNLISPLSAITWVGGAAVAAFASKVFR